MNHLYMYSSIHTILRHGYKHFFEYLYLSILTFIQVFILTHVIDYV